MIAGVITAYPVSMLDCRAQPPCIRQGVVTHWVQRSRPYVVSGFLGVACDSTRFRSRPHWYKKPSLDAEKALTLPSVT
jgi:hypothetical protein